MKFCLDSFRLVRAIPVFSIAIACALALGCGRDSQSDADSCEEPVEQEDGVEEVEIDPLAPVRPFPDAFPPRSCMPDVREIEASGAISNSAFSPGRDLVYVDDQRVWWESDNDGETDDECDHSMHQSMELPFRRLVELCCASNAQLRVQESYRPIGTHSKVSLHKEGRAIDLTCPMLDPSNPNPEKPTLKSLEILCKLAWAAGFDWVYFECPKNKYNGPHLHASVRREADGE